MRPAARQPPVLALAAAAVLVATALPASAATIEVTIRADHLNEAPETCALREAITSANTDTAVGGCAAGSGADEVLVPRGTYILTREGSGENANAFGDLDVTQEMVLAASGSGRVAINADGLDRVLEHLGGNELTIRGMTLRGGLTPGVQDGGAIRNSGGTLNLDRVALLESLTTGNGGGLANLAVASLANVTISGNEAGGSGGGIYSLSSTGTTTLRNVTIAENSADSNGDETGDGGGIAVAGGVAFTTYNSVIATNSDFSVSGANRQPDCSASDGFFPSYTLIGVVKPAGCPFAADPGTNVIGGARLGGLGTFGGTVPTHGLQRGSAAIDAGGESGLDACTATDQRGVDRSLGGRCDLGAYERVECDGTAVNRFGTAEPDTLTGTRGSDVFLGLGGSDRIAGRRGSDVACGGRGRDAFNGGPGADRGFGEQGDDTLKGGDGNDDLRGGSGRVALFGGFGRDRLFGGPDDDLLRGGIGRDQIFGGAGDNDVRD